MKIHDLCERCSNVCKLETHGNQIDSCDRFVTAAKIPPLGSFLSTSGPEAVVEGDSPMTEFSEAQALMMAHTEAEHWTKPPITRTEIHEIVNEAMGAHRKTHAGPDMLAVIGGAIKQHLKSHHTLSAEDQQQLDERNCPHPLRNFTSRQLLYELGRRLR